MHACRTRSAYLPYIPWCCLISLPILLSSSLVVLQPVADVASFVVLGSWIILGVQAIETLRGHVAPRLLLFTTAACLTATAIHALMLQVTGQACVLTEGLGYLYWQAFVSPEAPFACAWCVG